MKHHSKQQIEAFCTKLWAEDSPEVSVKTKDHVVTIKLEQMYRHVDHSFATLLAVSQFFGTMNIESSEWSQRGCDTCDYGSNYAIELTIRPEEPK